jgi:predicted DCC family thiol-disulfide oxidoreductase YuxK
MSANSELVIIYDGDCPFCSRYVDLLRLRDTVGPVRLVDARSGATDTIELQRAGCDLNVGMVAKYENRIYHGADCVNFLALLSSESGTFNKINRVIFGSPLLAHTLYPILRLGRVLTLRLLGRTQIEQIKTTSGRDRDC